MAARPPACAFAPAETEKRAKHDELEQAEADLDAVRQHRFVVLREEGLDNAGPDEQQAEAADERDEIVADGGEPIEQRHPFSRADERAGQDKARPARRS